jgi:LEA14-like dessication related protein
MKIRKLSFLVIVLTLFLCGCSIVQAVKLKDCIFQYSHISDVTFLEMTRSELLSIQGIMRVTRFIKSPDEEVKMGFTLHMKVTNPNKGIASMERLYYTICLDDSVQVAEGNIPENFTVLGGTSADLALPLSFSMKQLFSGKSKASVSKLAWNTIGRGDSPSKITVNLRPVIRVGGAAMSIPKSIPLTFEYPTPREGE